MKLRSKILDNFGLSETRCHFSSSSLSILVTHLYLKSPKIIDGLVDEALGGVVQPGAGWRQDLGYRWWKAKQLCWLRQGIYERMPNGASMQLNERRNRRQKP